jgi:hypothetical protein
MMYQDKPFCIRAGLARLTCTTIDPTKLLEENSADVSDLDAYTRWREGARKGQMLKRDLILDPSHGGLASTSHLVPRGSEVAKESSRSTMEDQTLVRPAGGIASRAESTAAAVKEANYGLSSTPQTMGGIV